MAEAQEHVISLMSLDRLRGVNMRVRIRHNITAFDSNKYHVVNGILKRRRIRRPKKMIFLCGECGTVHNYLPIGCTKCGSIKLEEKVVGHFNKPVL